MKRMNVCGEIEGGIKLSQPKDMQIRPTGYSKMPKGVNVNC